MLKKQRTADRAVVENAATTLYANIRFADVDHPVRTMAITSSVPNEGKTTVAVNLARAIGASGKSVLLVECDMRRRSLAARVAVHSRAGLYSVLAEQVSLKQAIVPTSIANVSFLDAEPGIPNPVGILTSKRFKHMIAECSASFDYVICDTPPVGAFVDAALIAAMVDGAVVVVRNDFTKRGDLALARGQLEKTGARVIGAVLNCAEVAATDHYYEYYTKDGNRSKDVESRKRPQTSSASGSSGYAPPTAKRAAASRHTPSGFDASAERGGSHHRRG